MHILQRILTFHAQYRNGFSPGYWLASPVSNFTSISSVVWDLEPKTEKVEILATFCSLRTKSPTAHDDILSLYASTSKF